MTDEYRANETPTPQFKVDIRNAPIQEEDGDAETALANVANTLRAVIYTNLLLTDGKLMIL